MNSKKKKKKSFFSHFSKHFVCFFIVIFFCPCFSSENVFWRTDAFHTDYCTLTLWFPLPFMLLSFRLFIYCGDDFSTIPDNFSFITSASNSTSEAKSPFIRHLQIVDLSSFTVSESNVTPHSTLTSLCQAGPSLGSVKEPTTLNFV